MYIYVNLNIIVNCFGVGIFEKKFKKFLNEKEIMKEKIYDSILFYYIVFV